MIVTTIETIPGMKIKAHCGMVSGSTVRAKNMVMDFGAGLKNAIGGELKSYTELLTEAREEAISRMIIQAEKLHANAIVNVRLATSSVAAGAAEVYAYGTAVEVYKPEG
ncbi:YbjQ family protein [bacterium]|nr:YbjQ family protein [bacterium]